MAALISGSLQNLKWWNIFLSPHSPKLAGQSHIGHADQVSLTGKEGPGYPDALNGVGGWRRRRELGEEEKTFPR